MPIKIKSTSGSVTLDAQNVSGDQTLTVPSQSGATLQTTADTITSSRLSGNLPALNAASLTSLTSGNLTGALPAISGASLTGLPAGGVDGISSASSSGTAIAITSTNNVGLGTVNADSNLHVIGTGRNVLKITDASNYTMEIGRLGTTGEVGFITMTGTTAELAFGTYNGTERFRITADGRGKSQFTAKAWANFDGTGSAGSWEFDSHNVSSYNDDGTGNYRIHFANSLANKNYAVACTDDDFGCIARSYSGSSNSYFTLYVYDRNSGNRDTVVNFVVFGD